VLLECEHVALRRIGLRVVERRDGLRALAKRRMCRHVIDALGADIDDAAVAHALELALSGDQHAATFAPSGADWGRAEPAAIWCLRLPRNARTGRSRRAARSRRGPSARSPARSAPPPDRSPAPRARRTPRRTAY